MLLPRESELAALRQALDTATNDGGRAILLRGEVGIGKTTLVSQFVASIDNGVRTLVGYCDNLRTPQPFGPLWDMREHDGGLQAALGRSDHRAVVDALLGIMSSASGGPSTIVVEDTQWADEATLDALRAVGRRVSQTSGLLVLTYRDAEIDYDHPVRSVIAAIPPDRIDRLTLQPLTTGEVERLAGERVTDIDRLMELSNGNPLLVEEIAASGLELVPPPTEDWVAARFATVSTKARQLLEMMSVVPGGLEAGMLAVLDLQDGQSLAEARKTGWLEVGSDWIAFRHEVIRQAVESMLSDELRTRTNRRFAEALIDEGAAPARIAHHAEEAGMAGTLFEYARKAGVAATTAGSHREALAHYRALGVYLDDIDVDERVDVLGEWTTCEFHNDDPAAVALQEQLIEIHRERNDVPALVHALAFAVRLYQSNGRPDDARLAAEEALALGTVDSAGSERAYVLGQSAWLSLMHGQPSNALDRSQEAIELAETSDDPSVLVQAMGTKGTALLPDRRGVALLERAGQLAADNGLWFEHGRALINRAQVGIVKMRDLDKAEVLARRAVEVGVEHELEGLRTFATSQLATILFYNGDWDAASELSYAVLGANRQTDATALTRLGTIQARTSNRQAESTLERAWSVSEQLGEMQHIAAVSVAWAEFCWISGREPDPSLSRCAEVMANAANRGLDSSAERIAAWLYQMKLLHVSEEIEELVDTLAKRCFDLWRGGSAPYDHAIAQLVVQSGQEPKSLETLETLGAASVAAKHRQRLRAAGVSVPRGRSSQARAHPAGLTARQAEVLELLSDDLSNAQIADRLFLSLRTVEKHVSAVLGKLGVASRSDAVTIALERGLIPG